MISIVVVTYNRLSLLRRCVEDVLRHASDKTREIIVWNNASVDGTREYLDTLEESRLRIVHHSENIGTNAYAHAFALATQEYLVELDDDVIEAPDGWDEQMLAAFVGIPKMGYLSANLVDDPNDSASQYVKYLHEERNAYTRREINGITILEGPTRGGGCTMTSRELYERIGGFRQSATISSFGTRTRRTCTTSTGSGIAPQCWRISASGMPEARTTRRRDPQRTHFTSEQARINARKDFVKRVLLRAPFIAALNARHGWFEPPHAYQPPKFGSSED